MISREFQERLSQRAEATGLLFLDDELMAKLEAYYRLLALWNEKINLTGLDLRAPGPETFDRLLLEPIVATKHIVSARAMIDIGSGGGSPAIPMALVLSPVRLHMVESRVKKSVFLREAIRSLELSGADVFTSRYEALLSDPAFMSAYDLLTVRAVRIDHPQLKELQSFIEPGGKMLLFRGPSSGDIQLVPSPLSSMTTIALNGSSQSRLLVIEKARERER